MKKKLSNFKSGTNCFPFLRVLGSQLQPTWSSALQITVDIKSPRKHNNILHRRVVTGFVTQSSLANNLQIKITKSLTCM